MRRTIISIILACQCLIVFPVDYQTAVRIASNYVDLPDRAKVKARTNCVSNEGGDYYIFNDRVQGNGFVIISGKDDVNPVLGYSDKGFVNEDNIPAPLQFFLNQAGASAQSSATAPLASEPAHPVVAPLIKTQWYQLEPYNAKAPGPEFLTGCVATAMAQVMNYHRWPERGHGSITYTSYSPSDGDQAEPVGELSRNLSESVYDWDNMLPTYQNGSWNDAQVEAVSTLMRDCGYAAHMLYRTTESSSFDQDAATALVQNFGYYVQVYPHFGDYNTEMWLSLIKNELDNGYPVIMTGQAIFYGGKGHCFIADGYDSNDFVHINWGWNGDADGYFNIVMLNPVHKEQSLNYSYMQYMTAVHPRRPYSDATYNPWLVMLYDHKNKNLEHSGLTVENENVTLDNNTSGQIRIDGLVYVSSYPINGTFNLVLTDANGAEIKTVVKRDFDYKGLHSADDNQLVGLKSITVEAAAFEGVADGDYRLVPMTQVGGMTPQRVQGYGYKNYVNVNIADGKVRLTNVPKPEPKLSVARMMTVEQEVPLFSSIKGEIEITNSGDFIEGGKLNFYADPKDGSAPVTLLSCDIVLYANQSLTVPVELPILPYAFNGNLLTDKEYTLVFDLTDFDHKAIELENNFESPQFKVIYNPEYLPTTTISSVRVTDINGVELDLSNLELDVNGDYSFHYLFETTAKELTPQTFDVNLEIEGSGITIGPKEGAETTGESIITVPFMIYASGLPLGDYYLSVSHSDFLTPENFIVPQPAARSRLKVKFVDSSSGIDDISTDSPVKETARYNLQGIKVQSDSKGFVIIHYSDGSRRKVFVKYPGTAHEK